MTTTERIYDAAPVRPKAVRRRQVGVDARHNGAAFVFLAPWIVGVLCLTLGPILASFYLSLTSYDMFTAPEWIGLCLDGKPGPGLHMRRNLPAACVFSSSN